MAKNQSSTQILVHQITTKEIVFWGVLLSTRSKYVYKEPQGGKCLSCSLHVELFKNRSSPTCKSAVCLSRYSLQIMPKAPCSHPGTPCQSIRASIVLAEPLPLVILSVRKCSMPFPLRHHYSSASTVPCSMPIRHYQPLGPHTPFTPIQMFFCHFLVSNKPFSGGAPSRHGNPPA